MVVLVLYTSATSAVDSLNQLADQYQYQYRILIKVTSTGHVTKTVKFKAVRLIHTTQAALNYMEKS